MNIRETLSNEILLKKKWLLKDGWFSTHKNVFINENGLILSNTSDSLVNILKLHGVEEENILLLFHKKIFENNQDDIFRADRTYYYSTAFLEHGISFVVKEDTKGLMGGDGWDSFYLWEDIVKSNYNNGKINLYLESGETFDFGLGCFGGINGYSNLKEKIPEIINLIITTLQDYSNKVELNEHTEQEEGLESFKYLLSIALKPIDSYIENEKLFILEVKECLKENNPLSEADLKLLDRFSTKLAISSDKTKELIDCSEFISINPMSSKELEYVDELKFYLGDDFDLNFSSNERRALNKEIQRIGISKERAESLERELLDMFSFLIED